MPESRPDPDLSCPTCGTPTPAQAEPSWWRHCPECGLEMSTLAPALDERPMAEMFDWEQRERALGDLRRHNFERVLDRIVAVRPPPGRVLDVGCAEGRFLEAALGRGYEVQGLEIDPRMAAAADARLAVRTGAFPGALEAHERFDVIAFNDVFEHLAAPGDALAACRRHLRDGGVLALTLPDARGGLYRLARVLLRIGIRGPFERMWQAGYPSPHLCYFTPETLRRLAARHGFGERARTGLPAIRARGLWARVRYDRSRPLVYALAAWAGVLAALPVLAAMPSDINAQIFEKHPA